MYVEKDHVVRGVSWGIVHFQAPTGNIEHVAALNCLQAFSRYRENVSPELLHTLTIDAARAGKKTCGINQMWCSLALDVDLCLRHRTKKQADAACVIKMNMRQEQMGDVLWIEAGLAQPS